MRREAMARREAAYRATGSAAAGEGLRDRFLGALGDIIVPAQAVVSGYFAMGAELDPAPLLDALRAAGRETAYPVVTAARTPLTFRTWAPGDPLEDGVFGTRHPGAAQAAREPDLVLAPLLAFDRRGRRLGYGGGFYDRTIARLRSVKPVAVVGVCFAVQEVDKVPSTDEDQALDWIVTEKEVIKAA